MIVAQTGVKLSAALTITLRRYISKDIRYCDRRRGGVASPVVLRRGCGALLDVRADAVNIDWHVVFGSKLYNIPY